MQVDFKAAAETSDWLTTDDWNRERRIRQAVAASVFLGLSATCWLRGLAHAVWPIWLLMALAIALHRRAAGRLKRAADRRGRSPGFRLEIHRDAVHWSVLGQKSIRYCWTWIKRVSSGDSGIALELYDHGQVVGAPASAFSSGADQQRMADLAERAHQSAESSPGLLPRTDIGEELFVNRGTVEPVQTGLTRGFYVWCVIGVGMLLFSLLTDGGGLRVVIAFLSLLILSIATLSGLNWLQWHRHRRGQPQIHEQSVVATSHGLLLANNISDEFTPWSVATDLWLRGDEYQLVNRRGEVITWFEASRLESEADAEMFLEIAQKRIAVAADDVEPEVGTNEERVAEHGQWPGFPDSDDATPASTDDPAERTAQGCVFIAPLVLFALGVWGNYPWIELEHQRMELWRIPIFWMSEATGLFWYLVYLIGSWRETPRRARLEYIAWATLLVGLAADLAVTMNEVSVEHAAHRRSVPAAEAEAVNAVFGEHRGRKQLRRLDCVFVDQNGLRHTVTYASLNTKFPRALKQTAFKGEFPFPLGIHYDPEFPQRHWLSDAFEPHYNRLYWLSATLILLSTLLGAVFVLLGRQLDHAPPSEIAPFLVASFIMGLVGVLRLTLL